METNNNHFWMVWFMGKPALATRYHTFNEARLGAEELLRMPDYEGCTAHILESCSYGVIESVPVTWVTVP